MTTFYIDYEGGNDANAGTSFATRWKTFTNGATAARIAPGDTIRVMASPDPTLVGNATWTNGPRPATVTISSSTNATPIVVTTSAAHGMVAGDYVAIAGHSGNTSANGVWKVGTVTSTTLQLLQMDGTNTTGNGAGFGGTVQKATNCIVKLASPVTQNVALCGGLGQKPLWTAASANVATTQNVSDYKEGYSCASIALSLAFTTGLAAYTALPATLNLSGYQQVSFWIKQTAGTLGAAGAVRLALCSDAVGATVVNALDIPVIGALSTWQQVTVNLGTNLGSSINSVAFYVITDNGAQTFLIDNIIACKATSSADSLNLTSLISKSDGTGDEAWYAIQSINYDAVMLANTNVALSTGPLIRGYLGSTGTVSTYKRETIKIAPVASATTGSSTVTDSGNAGSLITYSGGWNRTDMSTQTGFTWYDGQNGLGRQYYIGNFSYIKMERLCLVRGYSPAQSLNSSTNCQVYSMYATANTQGSFVGGLNHYYDLLWINNNQNNVYISNAAGIVVNTVKTSANAEQNCFAMTSTSFGVVKDAGALTGNTQGTSSYQAPMYFASAANCSIANLNITGSGGYAISCGGATTAVVVEGGSCTNSAYSGVNVDNGTTIYLNNFTISDATEVNVNQVGSIGVYSNAHDNTQGNNWVFAQGWTANQQTSVIDSPATTSWKLSPTTTNVTSQMPAQLKLGTVVVSAGTLVTVTARMRRSNTGLTVQLVCPGGQISGVSADVISSMTAAADTWETVTITFTPTKAGGVDIYAYAFGGTTYSGYVCNLTASQA